MSITPVRPSSPDEVQQLLRDTQTTVLPHGGHTKNALSTPPQAVTPLDMRGLSGILEYDPSEYTFTALAGTLVSEVQSTLAENGQYLPCDPPFGTQGATLGGTIASGLSSSGRYRYGGVRDFLIGVRFVDGGGRLVVGGGKVVKNSAGFDFPKLLVGSLGRLAVLVEVTFKVFPSTEAQATLRIDYPTIETAVDALQRAGGSTLDMQALDLEVPSTLVIRVGGVAAGLRGRIDRVHSFLERDGEVLLDDQNYWSQNGEFQWRPSSSALVKVPLIPSIIPSLERSLSDLPIVRRYSVGGNVAWLSPADEGAFGILAGVLKKHQLRGLRICSWEAGLTPNSDAPLFCGQPPLDEVFAERVRSALDPQQRFLELV